MDMNTEEETQINAGERVLTVTTCAENIWHKNGVPTYVHKDRDLKMVVQRFNYSTII